MQSLDNLRSDLLEQVMAASSLDALEDARVKALGKKGAITAQMKGLGGLAPEERKSAGAQLNALKDEVAEAIETRKQKLHASEMQDRLAAEKSDVTLPVAWENEGRLHPISQVQESLLAIFGRMGFKLADGPDIEDDFHNFEALNFPPDHPAREMQDTLYLRPGESGQSHILRTHTSPVQIRTMRGGKPPFRVIVMGRTYRSDYDLTHTPMFHQIEGLVIDEKTHMGHLKGCLLEACEALFEVENLPIRFRPSFFPFTEPSAEVDIGCSRKGGDLKIGAGDDWLEIGGCGMVHPNVIRNCGLDPEKYQGFAFGMGIERIAMLKYGIPDLRTFFEADNRWLKHYGFSVLERPNMTWGTV